MDVNTNMYIFSFKIGSTKESTQYQSYLCIFQTKTCIFLEKQACILKKLKCKFAALVPTCTNFY